jgi:hypothetical protein
MEWRRKQHELACVNFRVVNWSRTVTTPLIVMGI